ncbi:MAG: GDSL-type esterase/lipase family protein [Planctomycetota bacterium]
MTVVASPDDLAERTWNGQQAYAIDPVAGLRPRRSATFKLPMLAVDQSDVRQIEKHRDAHGLLREQELPAALDRPAVLVVGDSHIDGVVSTADNVTSLLEQQSQSSPTPYYCLNAGCGYYSLWQHVLRARDLLPRFRPRVVVIVVFLGNDFLDLDNPTVPHLDDAAQERPARERSEPETTSARLAEFALPEPYGQLFWQGLNQALVLHREPTRLDRWMAKAAHAVAAMERAATQHDAKVLWALLPSFDLVLPDQAQGLGKLADEVVRSGAQRRVRDAFAKVLEQANARVVDAEPAFRADGKSDLYALDFHIYRRGHRRLFEALRSPIDELLARR